MPWWSWVLIWTGLVLVLLATLALLALWLFRKGQALLAEVARFEELQSQLEARASELVEPYDRRQNAIVRGGARVERERTALNRIRDARKERRRAARLANARVITSADPMQYAHLVRKK